MQLYCGNYQTYILTPTNTIFACGWKSSYEYEKIFTEVKHNFKNIKYIVCCEYNTFILNDNNEIFTFHKKVENNFGTIKNIFGGPNHAFILNDANEIFAVGANYFGQLGLDDIKNRKIFTKVEHNMGNIKNIICCEYHTIILNDNNEIFSCGADLTGNIGYPYKKDINIFTKEKNDFGNIKNIFGGSLHAFIINDKNEIFVCGSNNSGQIGIGEYKDNVYINFTKVKHNFGNIKNIFCGNHHTFILNDKNEIFVTGCNEYGQLGLGDYHRCRNFKKLDHNVGEIKSIVCGNNKTFIITAKNEIFACGHNESGQLGLGDVNNRNIFTQINTEHIMEKIYDYPEFEIDNDTVIDI